MKIQASGHGPHEPSISNTFANATVPIAIVAIIPTRARVDAQCGSTALPESCRDWSQRVQPYALT